jgi:predicted N-acetyltransferase YhbS
MSPEVVPVTGPLLEQILDATHPIWGEGLSRQAYGRYNAAQLRTAWGTDHLRRVALVDNGRLLATAKCYNLRARVDGHPVSVLGLGAVFTPLALRGRGHASELLGRLMSAAAAEGARFAMLFSEIAPAFYRRLGLAIVPVDQVLVEVDRRPGAPAMPLRSGEKKDAPAIAAMHAARSAPYRFALERTPEQVLYAMTKKRLLAGLGPPGAKVVDFFVAEEGGQAAAYVVILRSGGAWTVSECGDRDPSGARVGALLQGLLARSPGAPLPSMRSWLPSGFVPPQVRLVRHERPPVALMLGPIGTTPPIDPPLQLGDAMYWHADAF